MTEKKPTKKPAKAPKKAAGASGKKTAAKKKASKATAKPADKGSAKPSTPKKPTPKASPSVAPTPAKDAPTAPEPPEPETGAEDVEAATKAPPKRKPSKKPAAKDEDVTIVEEGEATQEYTPKLKPELDQATRSALALRAQIAGRRPAFRRQQWFEYKRLEGSGWRRPTGQDSAQRRHFGYRPPVVSVGYRGPKAARGLHASGFREVRVETLKDLESIDPKTQAARLSGQLGKRKLEKLYAEADKRKIRILNRRSI